LYENVKSTTTQKANGPSNKFINKHIQIGEGNWLFISCTPLSKIVGPPPCANYHGINILVGSLKKHIVNFFNYMSHGKAPH